MRNDIELYVCARENTHFVTRNQEGGYCILGAVLCDVVIRT